MSEPIILSGEPVTIEAAASGKRFVGVAYSGGLMSVGGWGPLVIDLAGLELPATVPLRVDHGDGVLSTIGEGVARVEAGRLTIQGIVATDTEAGAHVAGLARSGIRLELSVGAQPIERRLVSAAEIIRANGRSFSGENFTLVEKSKLVEVSIVPKGADLNGTSISIAAAAADAAPITFEEWIDAIGVTADDLQANPDLEKRLRVKYEEATGNKPDDTSDSDSPPDEKEEETMIATELQAAVDATIRGADISPEAAKLLRAEAITGKMTFNDFERAVIKCAKAKADLEALRASRPKGPTIMAGHHAADKHAVQAALFKHLGLEAIGEKTLGAHAMEAGAALRCTHFLDVVKASLTAAGRDIPASRDDMIRAAFSTADLAGMLGNTANKLLLDAYQAVPSVARTIARPLSANNFKSHTGYRLTGDNKFELVPPTGELKHGTLGESAYAFRVDTYGRMFGLTRTQIIDDDLGALQTIPTLCGRGAAVKLEETFWQLVLANTGSFFSGGNGNYISGGGSALDITSLGTAVTRMRQMVDSQGVPVLVVPKFLVVPPELEATADALYVSTNVVATGATDLVTPAGNPHANKYQPLVVPFLSNATYSGYSATAWYLFGDPSDVAAFAIAYLNGVESPVVESQDAPFNTLGVQFRGFMDFGVAQLDSKGGVMSAGA